MHLTMCVSVWVFSLTLKYMLITKTQNEILRIDGFLWLVGCVLWYINPCWLFNAKSGLYIYTIYMRFVNVKFLRNIFKPTRDRLLNGFK